MKHSPHLIIGVTGAAGAGKTTVCRRVHERLRFTCPKQSVQRAKFASPIREMLRLIGVEKGDGPGEVAHELFRDSAQYIGQFFRDRDENFWVKVLVQYVNGLSSPTIVLLDDVRYPNEAAVCDILVKLYSCRMNDLTAEQMLHPSEVGWHELEADIVVDNDDPSDVDAIAKAVVARAMARMKEGRAA